MRSFKEKFKISTLSKTVFSIIWCLDSSFRFRKINYDPALAPAIYAVWHGWQYGLLSFRSRNNINLLVSQSNDGEIISRISRKLGYSIIRGSRGRGGASALRNILKALKAGESIAYTVDGPRGPIFKVKEGIIKIAQMSQVPIIPLVPSARWKITAKSWDKYQIPALFSKIPVVFGDPIYIPKNLNDDDKEHYRLLLENKLFELKNQADRTIH